ncbi:hypothetical protein AB6813_05960 [bacterium RCC_150]
MQQLQAAAPVIDRRNLEPVMTNNLPCFPLLSDAPSGVQITRF